MRLLALALLGLAALAAPVQAADETVAELPRPTAIDALGFRIAYSAYDPAARMWRLMVQSGDEAPLALPVPPERSRFDVDLGPGPDGRGPTVLVYSRCGGPRRCEIYLYDFKLKRERRLRGPSTGADESQPSIWRRRVAFLRDGPGRPRLFVTGLDGGREREIATGPRPRGASTFVSSLELDWDRLAYVWGIAGRDRDEYQMRLHTFGRGQRLVSRVRGGEGAVAMLQPTLLNGRLLYGVARSLGGSSFQRYDSRTGDRHSVPAPPNMLAAASIGYFSRFRFGFAYVQTPYDEEGAARCQDAQGDPAPCRLRYRAPVSFRRRR